MATFYNLIQAVRGTGGDLWKHLRRRGKKPNRKGESHAGWDHIPGRVEISERPDIVEAKERIGDWEADTIVAKVYSGAIVSLIDRAAKFIFLGRVDKKTKNAVGSTTIRLLGSGKVPIHTITADNGKEIADHSRVAKADDADFYFARPFHSWERGLNEHINGLVRGYFPKRNGLLHGI